VYVFAGLIVVGIISFRGTRFRCPPIDGGPLWDEKDNLRNYLFWFLAIGKWHPVGIVLEILLWPVWLVFFLLSR
jgi:hypothetical protein